MFFDNNVAYFASTHSKTLQSDVIGRRQHGIRDHSSISTLMTKLIRKQWILTISPLVSDCRIGYNFSVSYSNGLTYLQTMPSHSIHVHAKFNFENFNSKHDIVVGIYHARNNHFLTNQMLSDSHVAYFASTHSKTRHSDVIGRRQHGRRDHGSISTLMTKLSLTLIYRCRYFPCTEQSLFDQSDVYWLSCRFCCINTFENTPVGCNIMPPTQKTWPQFDIHINDDVIKETMNNCHQSICLRLYDRL